MYKNVAKKTRPNSRSSKNIGFAPCTTLAKKKQKLILDEDQKRYVRGYNDRKLIKYLTESSFPNGTKKYALVQFHTFFASLDIFLIIRFP